MIYEILAAGNTSLASRKKMVEMIGKQPNLISTLVAFTFDATCKVNVLASIVLDDLVQENPLLLDDDIERFILQLSSVKDESVKRLTSKMTIVLVEKRQSLLNATLEEAILDQCLIWLTSETKVATEANAMHIIMRLAAKFPEQAKLIAELIEVRFAAKTPAYQSKARKLLKKVSALK
ncbi:hypothetical protein [Myroides sp. TSA_177.3]|uniref:hypothetical protein n=1 Tax=Myroides sp. TSA_177.3 TaxID=3415650 RepID=UPI0040459C03